MWATWPWTPSQSKKTLELEVKMQAFSVSRWVRKIGPGWAQLGPELPPNSVHLGLEPTGAQAGANGVCMNRCEYIYTHIVYTYIICIDNCYIYIYTYITCIYIYISIYIWSYMYICICTCTISTHISLCMASMLKSLGNKHKTHILLYLQSVCI